MKCTKIILFFLITVFSVSLSAETLKRKKKKKSGPAYNYVLELRKVDSLLVKVDQPKSAQEVLNSIKQKAQADNEKGYYIRCLQAQYIINNTGKEADDTLALNWKLIQSEISIGTNDIKAFLNIDAAHYLKDIYQQNRWQNERIFDDKSANPKNWSMEKLNAVINTSLDDALKYAENMDDSRIYEPLIAHFKDYDFKLDVQQILMRSAIEILNDLGIPYNADYKMPDGADVIAPYDQFISKNFVVPSDPKNEYKTLMLYQKFLKSIKQENAFVYFEIERLNNLRNLYNKEVYGYEKALTALKTINPSNPYNNLVAEELAGFYQNTDPAKSIAIIESALKEHPGFINEKNLLDIKRSIENPEIALQMENVNQPGHKLLAMVDYTNLDTVYITAFRINYIDFIEQTTVRYGGLNRDVKEYLDSLKPFTKTYSIILPKYTDYKSHSAEMALDSLPAGTYVILAGNEENTSDKHVKSAYGIVSIAPYTIVENDEKNYLFNAVNGKVCPGQAFTIFEDNQFRYNSDKKRYAKIYEGTTDANGLIDLSGIGNEKSFRSMIIEIGDHYLYDSKYLNLGGRENNNDRSNAVAFKTITDRSIYRPGQKVHFKCIAYDNKAKKTVANEKIVISLRDNNREEKAKIALTTNMYGSVSGTFVLPAGGINTGDFYIAVNDNFYTGFKVEEYKRPKYSAKFLVPEKAFKLNDKVTLVGEAKAFAGYAVQDAKVVYNVSRIMRQRWWYDWSDDSRGGSSVTIINGETVTDKEGQFSVNFTALPAENISEQTNPYFIFEVNAVLTDLNGEVRTCQYFLNMAYTDRQVSIKGNSENWLGNPLSINYSCTNLQDKQLPFTGTITVEKVLKNPQVMRARLWEKTDTSAMNENEFKAWFPAYENLNRKTELKTILNRSFTNDTSKELIILPAELKEEGTYKATINSMDSRGKILTSSFQFSVVPKMAGIYQLPDALTIKCINGSSFEPKGVARLLVSTGAKNARIILSVNSNKGILLQRELLLDKSSQMIEIPVTNADRGNIQAMVYMVNDYRFYSATTVIEVPYSNKELSLHLSSFRDATEPGAKEKWIVKLKGPASEKAAMESVAVMYDQSLDAIYENANWRLWIFDNYYHYNVTSGSFDNIFFNQLGVGYNSYEYLNDYQFKIPAYLYEGQQIIRRFKPLKCPDFGGAEMEVSKVKLGTVQGYVNVNVKGNNIGYKDEDGVADERDNKIIPPVPVANVRKNFEETAFFYPHLYTDAKGDISMEFTMPEALTQWKMRMLAHSTTMQSGYLEHSITTSKKIMVQPNVPRFFCQGDKITIASKIVNTTSKSIDAKANFTLVNEATGEPLKWLTDNNEKRISIAANSSSSVTFSIKVPDFTGVVTLAITSTAGVFSDGEQHTLPVLSKRKLITESMPITIRESGTQNLEFAHLKSNNSHTLSHEKLSVEMCNNPAWYAVQALPYMMEFPHECAEQIFTRLYANSIAVYLANSNPEIRKVYKEWELLATKGGGLQSKLQQNEDLKSTLIEETPWVNEARNETERMQKLGLLFDDAKMKEAIQLAFEKLKQMQFENGAFGWFKGMQANTYITQTIVIGFGKMRKMGVDITAYKGMVEKAMRYLDEEAKRDYMYYHTLKDFKNFYPGNLQYLYCKSYFPQTGLNASDSIVQYFVKNSEKTWTGNSLLNRAQLAISLKTLKPDSDIPGLILRSFNETAKQNDEMGMYWPDNSGGWYWYESPVETQAAIIELYSKYKDETSALKEQQIWLLRQKQTQNWKTTRSTADACYALIMQGSFLGNKQNVQVIVNNVNVKPERKEEGTGYYRQDIPKENIVQNSGNIAVTASTSDFAYGAVYWQYFEELNKIQSAGSGLSIKKKIFKVVNTATGVQRIEVLNENLNVGDIIEVSLSISTDRYLEFVHIKDLRGSGTEPVDIISSYRWQDGLGYYMSTKDASTNFFIDHMSKGIYQINYTLKVEQAGTFESGVATAQCMYAPEYAANSAGLLLEVK